MALVARTVINTGGTNYSVLASNETFDGTTGDVQLFDLIDIETGYRPRVGGLRDLHFGQRVTRWADSLADGIASAWTQTTANGGAIASTLGEGKLSTSTATNGSSQIVSPTQNYWAGQENWMNSAIRLGDTGVAGNIRRWGMFTVSGTTPQDGYGYELSGTTLNAVIWKAGSAVSTTAVGSWSEFAEAPFTLDANYHGWEIVYTANTVWFIVDNVVRHIYSGTSAAITTSPSLPITVTNVKTSGATDISIYVRNIGYGTFGDPANLVQGTWEQRVYAHRDQTRIAVTSAGLTNVTYTAGDQAGTQFSFANAARFSGGTGRVTGAVLMDESDQIGSYDLVLTRSSITLAADNAAYAISDTDAAAVVGIVQLNGAFDIGNNRIAQASGLSIPYDCSGGTTLYGGLVVRIGHGGYASAGLLKLTLFVERD